TAGITVPTGTQGSIDLAADLTIIHNGSAELYLRRPYTSDTTGPRKITKTGPGTLRLGGDGTNTYSGGVTLSQGTGILNNTYALGGARGTFTIGAGTSIDASVPFVCANNNPIAINGAFTRVAGSNQPIDFGTGAVTLASNVTANILTNAMTFGGAVSGAGWGI